MTYIDTLIEDIVLNYINEINTIMMNREQQKMCIETVERPKKMT